MNAVAAGPEVWSREGPPNRRRNSFNQPTRIGSESLSLQLMEDEKLETLQGAKLDVNTAKGGVLVNDIDVKAGHHGRQWRHPCDRWAA